MAELVIPCSDYYDIMIIGRTGMGKSTTADKLIIANLTNRDYRGEQYEAVTMKDDRISMSDLTAWLISGGEREIDEMTRRLKILVIFRSQSDPHEEVKEFYMQRTKETTNMECQLISCETTKIRVMVVELPSTAPNKATLSKDLAIMREVLCIQAARRMNFKRILYFIPQRGPIERHSPVLQMELEIMMHYFGKSIFDCMVLVATLPPAVYDYIPSGVIPFSKDNEVMTQKNFQKTLSSTLLPSEHLQIPNCELPIIFISMNNTCEDIFAKILSAPVIYDGIRMAFSHQTCAHCGIKIKCLEKGAEKVRVACYTGEDPSQSIPYKDSFCHPMIVLKHRKVTRIIGGLYQTFLGSKVIRAWPDFLNPNDKVCVYCGQVPGTRGCTQVNTCCEIKNKWFLVDHVCLPADPIISIEHEGVEHEGVEHVYEYEHNILQTKISFLQQNILKCDHNGIL